ncbi:MAG TPA: sensor histidine kinase [Trebonia sp.]|jgi:signal transduction histidine kinase|nr:sensor histidine kinase [Trebonia sp.]
MREGGRGRVHALTVTGAMLAVAALVQAIVQAGMFAGGQRGMNAGSVAVDAVSLCLLALATTVPLVFLRPLTAAVFITAASVLALAASDVASVALMTAGGAAAQVIAVYRLGAADPGDSWPARYLALGLAAPFLVLALVAPGGVAAVLLASLVPAAAGTGIAVRSGRSASLAGVVRTELADTLTAHMARGERARIARELHDVVAHHISMISVQAETARLTVPDLSPEGAKRLREIGDTARAGLTEMRRLLGVLRSDVDSGAVGDRRPQPGLAQLAALINDSRTPSGGGVRLIVSGPVTSFDPGVELAAYRIVQEALTNARRHAPGAAVDVELRYAADLLRVRVRDNGPGARVGVGSGPGTGTGTEPGTGDGHGLLGMRERAATVGGTLRTCAAAGGGFVVEAELPAKPEAGS